MRWDNPITPPDWFKFPDLADFPDYSDCSERREIADYLPQFAELMKSVSAQDKNKFLSIISDYIGHSDFSWCKNLSWSFDKFVSDYTARRHSSVMQGAAFSDLYTKGLHVTSIDFSDIEINLRALVGDLLSSPDWSPPPGSYDRGRFLGHEIAALINHRFHKAGILKAVSAYHGVNRSVRAAYLHISTPTDSHFLQFLGQSSKTAPKWTNAHIDPKEDAMKAIIYLQDVTDDNGPFSYVCESNRWTHDALQEIFGRAICTGNYMDTPEKRSTVFCLPAPLRVSYNFGRCVPDGSAMDAGLDDSITRVTSDMGNVMIFDAGAGIHQGGIVKSGTRVSLQVLMK